MKQMIYALLMMSFISSPSVIYGTQTARKEEEQDIMREIKKFRGFIIEMTSYYIAAHTAYKINPDVIDTIIKTALESRQSLSKQFPKLDIDFLIDQVVTPINYYMSYIQSNFALKFIRNYGIKWLAYCLTMYATRRTLNGLQPSSF